MDLIKIGKFISSKRKEKNITQSELAEKLYITDRAISKWENGVCLPDAGNMPELCKILGITINDLFSGEVVDMKNNEKVLEENLLEMTRQKEYKDKQLLLSEVIILIILVVLLSSAISALCLTEGKNTLVIIFMACAFIIFLIGAMFCLKIEQEAGYYKCEKCNHKYVPTFWKAFNAPHIARTRYMKCPKCGKRSWQKKVIK